jgi:hypothetical protein
VIQQIRLPLETSVSPIRCFSLRHSLLETLSKDSETLEAKLKARRKYDRERKQKCRREVEGFRDAERAGSRKNFKIVPDPKAENQDMDATMYPFGFGKMVQIASYVPGQRRSQHTRCEFGQSLCSDEYLNVAIWSEPSGAAGPSQIHAFICVLYKLHATVANRRF